MPPHNNGIRQSYLQHSLENLLSYVGHPDSSQEQSVIREAIGAITAALKEIEEANQRTQETLQLYEELFDSCPDGYVITNQRGEIINLSCQAAALLGRTKQEVEGHAFELYIVPEDRARFHAQRQQVAQGEIVHNWNIHLQPAQGEPIPIDLSATSITDGEGVSGGFRWLIRNVTDQKRMQAELQEVRQRLAESREAERLNLAHELHDGPLQEISIIQWQLRSLAQHLKEEAVGESSAIQERLSRVLQTLRTITNELRPPVLSSFGLEAAIRAYVEDCQMRHPHMEFLLDLQEGTVQLPDWKGLVLFRVCQQALQNILQHAGAVHIWIHLTVNAEGVLLEITDDGQGFTVPESWLVLVREGHLGIAGMAERVETLNGHFLIDSIPDRGTTVRAVIPPA